MAGITRRGQYGSWLCSSWSTHHLVILSTWILLFLVGLHTPVDGAYLVNLAPKTEECFYVYANENSGTLYGTYEVVDDDDLKKDNNNNKKNKNKNKKPDNRRPTSSRDSQWNSPISLIVLDGTTQRTLFRSRRGSDHGTFRVSLKSKQKVHICIQNGLWNAGGKKKISRNPNAPELTEEHLVGIQYTFEETNPVVELQLTNAKLVTATKTVYQELSRLQDHYLYIRTREATHRETVEKTFTRLMTWVLLQGSVVIVVAGAQVLYFRRFLERRRYI